ncbi:MAG: hypothetical protein ACI9J2_002672 [Saprospiraceae bacterium]|jgi:hypothetical protein
MKKIVLLLTLVFGLSLISGCATQSDSLTLPGYRTARVQSNLELPPDLINTSNEAIKRRSEKATSEQVLPTIVGIEMKRNEGGERWLAIFASADDTWAKLVDYTLSSGLPILIQSKQKAIIETDWIGDESVSSGANKLLSFFSSGRGRSSLNDKFTFWLERVAENETALFVTHKRLRQVAKNRSKRGGVVEMAWLEEPGDGFQALEILRDIKAYYGGGRAEDISDVVVLVTTDNPHIVLREDSESAKSIIRKVLVAANYELVSENAKKNLFVIREHRKEGGLFSKLSLRQKFGVKVEPFGNDEKTKITITTSKGSTVQSKDSLPLLYRIAGELRK